MATREIICVNCGNAGEIELNGQRRSDGATRSFRHLGYNPFSGHIHCQCPACEIVLLVEPTSVLETGAISTIDCRASRPLSGDRRPWDSW